MSATEKRRWGIRSRSSFSPGRFPHIRSTSPISQSEQQTLTFQSKHSPASSDAVLLQNLRKLLSDYQQLCVINGTPITDTRIIYIRHQIERLMPPLYALTHHCTSSYITSEASLVRHLAEDFLRKFPDITKDILRSYQPVESSSRTHSSPHSLPKASPPHMSSPQTTIPHSSLPQALRPQLVLPQAIQKQSSHPQPSRYLTVSPQEYSNQLAVHQYRTSPPVTSRLNRPSPVISVDSNVMTESLHLQDSTNKITSSQEIMLFAIHELLSKRPFSRPQTRQPWHDPPAGLSPDEVKKASLLEKAEVYPTHSNARTHPFDHYLPSPPAATYHVAYPAMLADGGSTIMMGSHRRSTSHD